MRSIGALFFSEALGLFPKGARGILSEDKPGDCVALLPSESDPMLREVVEFLADEAADGCGLADIAGRMPSVCAYCCTKYDERPCVLELHERASHGICRSCAPRVLAEALCA